MQSDVERTLTKVPLFRQLGRAYMLDIAHNADLRDFEPGEAIASEGEEPDAFYVVVKGRVDVVIEREGGNRVLTTLGDGDYFGELSIFDGRARSATVRATETSTCLVIPRWEILQTVEASPEVSKRMLAYLSARLRETSAALAAD